MTDLSSNVTLLSVPTVQVVPATNIEDFWNFENFLFNASLSLLACSLFFACSLIHLSIALVTKRFYMLPLTVGCMLEIGGLISKIICLISTSTSAALNFYVIYSLCTNLVPCLFLTTIGWMLRRMMKASLYVGFSPVSKGISKQVVTLEVIVFLLQSYGLLVQANPLLSQYWSLGNWVTMIGCLIESFTLLWLWGSVGIVTRKQRLRNSATADQQTSTDFLGFAMIATISIAFMMIRTISKFVFHLTRRELEPFRNELLTFLLQVLPIALCAACLVPFHPCRYDGGVRNETPSFFSPEAPLGLQEGSDTRDSRNISMDGVLNRPQSSDRSKNHEEEASFWRVPVQPQLTSRKPSTPRVRFGAREKLPIEFCQNSLISAQPLQNVHRRSASNFEVRWAGRSIDSAEETLEIAGATIEAGENGRNPQEKPDTNILRRRYSAIYFERSPLGSLRVSKDLRSSPKSQFDSYSISSYYDGSSRSFQKEWSDRAFNGHVNSAQSFWDDDSLYSLEEGTK